MLVRSLPDLSKFPNSQSTMTFEGLDSFVRAEIGRCKNSLNLKGASAKTGNNYNMPKSNFGSKLEQYCFWQELSPVQSQRKHQ